MNNNCLQYLIKGTYYAKLTFKMLFEHKCVMAVCVHNHPIMIKTLSQNKPFAESVKCDIPRLLMDTNILAENHPKWPAHNLFIFTWLEHLKAAFK